MSIRKLFFSFITVAYAGVLLGEGAVWAQTSSPHFSFSPAATTIKVGETLAVVVEINTGGKNINSADAVIAFDSGLLEVISVGEGLFFPTTTSDTSVLGEIKIYGIADSNAPKTGTGTLATINFRAKKAGTARLTFSCQSGSTADSNINEGQIDVILCSANGTGSYTITAATTGVEGGVTPTSEATSTALPKTGVFELTGELLGIGFFLAAGGLAWFFKKRENSLA
ncbi:LPXTG cell wall anchor domain-containing protein [Candidatus Shapirobacteria bacterium]|nr:LPXTG cell wall anchor domain-containing protein [Candidatus Shapirobacteria bacterium]